MIYKNFKGEKLSALGVGTMRLPMNGDVIDEAQVCDMVDLALESGINYFDTAYCYHDGLSEVVVGNALKKHDRQSFYIADKFPGFNLSFIDRVEPIFEDQLKRLQTDYIDFYLFHNVYEKNVGPYLDPKHGIMEYLLKQKAAGRIRHLGFSCHGKYDVLKRFLDTYGSEMEFCQLQINYIDWDFQDAKAKVALLDSLNIPVWVMEPLRGGMLATLPASAEAILKSLRPDETVPAWAFRFLQSINSVCVTLSGMSSLEQLKQNIKTFESEKPLNESEMKALLDIATGMLRGGVVPCTACRYCTSQCPNGLDIPNLLSLYNEHKFSGGGFIAPMAVDAMPQEKRPESCIGCRSCEAVCPQQIKISECLADFVKILGE